MPHRGINDYEIIYLMQKHPGHEIYNLLVEKYQRLIYKNIYSLGAYGYEVDDLYQEGVIILLESARKFNPYYNKTFTRYFELVLRRHLIKIRSKDNLVLHDNYSFTNSYSSQNHQDYELEQFRNSLLTNIEKEVFQRYFIMGQSVSSISVMTKYSAKQIYNTIYRIKEKYKNFYNNGQ